MVRSRGDGGHEGGGGSDLGMLLACTQVTKGSELLVH